MTDKKKSINIAEEYFAEKGMKKFTCAVCGCEFYDFTGNNPYPIIKDENAVCCSACDERFVIPARRKFAREGDEDYHLDILTGASVDLEGDELHPLTTVVRSLIWLTKYYSANPVKRITRELSEHEDADVFSAIRLLTDTYESSDSE